MGEAAADSGHGLGESWDQLGDVKLEADEAP